MKSMNRRELKFLALFFSDHDLHQVTNIILNQNLTLLTLFSFTKGL